MSENNQEDGQDRYAYFIVLSIIIVGIWFLSYYLIANKYDWQIRGTFGDSFGAVNSLFSGLALAGIIYTIYLQRKELGLQRNELKETKEEFIIQNKTLRLQRFENTFFNLLSLHHQIVDAIDKNEYKEKRSNFGTRKSAMDERELEIVTLKGRDVFKDEFEKLMKHFNQSTFDFNTTYLKFYDYVQTDFGHYFRNLYRIIKLVNETEFFTVDEINKISKRKITTEDSEYVEKNFVAKYKYTSIVRAQISDYELLWLFYNCLSSNGKKKFKPLIEKFALFKNMPLNKIFDKSLLEEYEDGAIPKEE